MTHGLLRRRPDLGRAPLARFGASCYLVLALLLAPLLGSVHALVHGVAPGQHALTGLDLTPPDGMANSAGAGWLGELFSSHGGAADCLVFDQLSHGDTLPCPTGAAVPAQAVALWAPGGAAQVLLAASALYKARAPPHLSD